MTRVHEKVMRPRLNRRTVLAGAGALGLAGMSPAWGKETRTGQLSFAVPDPLVLDDPEHALMTYMKVMSDLSGRRTYRYHTGRILVVRRGGVGQPFMDFISCKQDRVRRLSDGSYQHSYKGVILFCELNTFRVLDRFDNPITGKTVDVRHFRTAQGSGVFTPYNGAYALRPSEEGDMSAPGLEDQAFKLGWDRQGNDLWITYDERIEVRDPQTQDLLYADSSMYRYHTEVTDLQNPDLASAPSIISWDTETTFWPWMQMQNEYGHLIFGSMGKKYSSLEDVPPQVIEESEKRIPNHLASPIEWSEHTLPDPALDPGYE